MLDGAGNDRKMKKGTRWKPLGYAPFPGTLNLLVDPETQTAIKSVTPIIGPGNHSGTARYFPIRLNGYRCHVKEASNAGKPIIYIVAPVNLRSHLKLKTGDVVEVEV